MWWDEVVERWTAALGLHADVCRRTIPQGREGCGSWFVEADVWFMTLDVNHCLRCPCAEIPAQVQDALSYTMRLAKQAAGEQSFFDIATWLMRMTQSTVEEVVASLTDQPAQSILTLPVDGPGYFVWIVFRAKSPAPQLNAVRDAVDQVVEAYLHQDPLAHVSIGSHSDSLLTFVPASIVADFELALRSEEADEVWHALAVLGAIGNDLVDMLAQDAFVDANVIFGRYVQSNEDFHVGMVSLELARRLQSQNTGIRVSVYGQSPLAHLLQAIPPTLRDVFLDTVRLRQPTSDWGTIPDELETTLKGLVEANLNVSEAARSLYLHRNTMNYRLERLRVATGYDVRQFFDAAALWIALTLGADNTAN